MQIGYRFNYVKFYFSFDLNPVFYYYYHNHEQLIKRQKYKIIK